VKQVIKNHIQVENANIWRHKPPSFYKEVQNEKPFKQNHSPNRNNNSKKRLVKKYITYPKRRYTTPLNATLRKVFTAIKRKDFIQ